MFERSIRYYDRKLINGTCIFFHGLLDFKIIEKIDKERLR